MAEWLGTGLQNPLQRFESASDLIKTGLQVLESCFILHKNTVELAHKVFGVK